MEEINSSIVCYSMEFKAEKAWSLLSSSILLSFFVKNGH